MLLDNTTEAKCVPRLYKMNTLSHERHQRIHKRLNDVLWTFTIYEMSKKPPGTRAHQSLTNLLDRQFGWFGHVLEPGNLVN